MSSAYENGYKKGYKEEGEDASYDSNEKIMSGMEKSVIILRMNGSMLCMTQASATRK